MKPKNYFLCSNLFNGLCFFCVLCVNCALTEDIHCSGDCSVLGPSAENDTDSSADSDESTYDGILDELLLNNISSSEFFRLATPCETPNHEPRYCVEIAQCKVLLTVANKKKYADFVEASRCGPSNENKKDFKVCCGKYNSFRNVSKQIDNIVDVNANVTTTKDKNIFPKQCGTQKTFMRGRIVGGIEAMLGEFPWLARIIHKNNYGYKTYGCAGFLIHTKYVVTAAHCIHSEFTRIRGEPYSVVLGDHNVETEIDCSPGKTFCADRPQVSRIDQITVHPEYSNKSKNHHNDIALIHLKKAVKLSEYVQPICLLTKADEEVNKYYISGWGKTESRESSPIKLKVDILPFDKEECKAKFNFLNLEINESQICAGGTKLKDSCNGDSGGPLMMSPNGTHYFAAGLVSYGIGCGMEGWPGVYTSMPSYIDWIQNEVLKTSISDRSARIKKRKTKSKNKQTTIEQLRIL